jgi:hypothetical protein
MALAVLALLMLVPFCDAQASVTAPASRAALDRSGDWGDRLYGYGEGVALPTVRTELEEGFDGSPAWSCNMSADDGRATLRSFEYEQGRALGLRVDFLRRSSSVVMIYPERPILVDARCVFLSLHILARSYRHELALVVLDYYGEAHRIPLGRLDFSGWKTLRAYVPLPDPSGATGIVQDDRHFSRAPGLRIAGIEIDFDAEEAYGTFYAYFDDLQATIEGLGPGSSPQAPLPSDLDRPRASEPAAATPVAGAAVAPSAPPPSLQTADPSEGRHAHPRRAVAQDQRRAHLSHSSPPPQRGREPNRRVRRRCEREALLGPRRRVFGQRHPRRRGHQATRERLPRRERLGQNA